VQLTDQVTDSGISFELRLKFCITINYIIIHRMHMDFCRHLAAELEKHYVGGSLSKRVAAYQKKNVITLKYTEQYKSYQYGYVMDIQVVTH